MGRLNIPKGVVDADDEMRVTKVAASPAVIAVSKEERRNDWLEAGECELSEGNSDDIAGDRVLVWVCGAAIVINWLVLSYRSSYTLLVQC